MKKIIFQYTLTLTHSLIYWLTHSITRLALHIDSTKIWDDQVTDRPIHTPNHVHCNVHIYEDGREEGKKVWAEKSLNRRKSRTFFLLNFFPPNFCWFLWKQRGYKNGYHFILHNMEQALMVCHCWITSASIFHMNQ